MQGSTLQVLAFVLITVGPVLTAIGGLCLHLASKRIEGEKAEVAKLEELSSFKSSISLVDMDYMWVHLGEDLFGLGIVARFLNSDATRALFVEGSGWFGQMRLVAGQLNWPTAARGEITSRGSWREATVQGDISDFVRIDRFLAPGDVTGLPVLLPLRFTGSFDSEVPILEFKGELVLKVRGLQLPFSIDRVRSRGLIELVAWEAL